MHMGVVDTASDLAIRLIGSVIKPSQRPEMPFPFACDRPDLLLKPSGVSLAEFGQAQHVRLRNHQEPAGKKRADRGHGEDSLCFVDDRPLWVRLSVLIDPAAKMAAAP